MTMLTFRVAESDAVQAGRWAEHLGIGRSELLREALRRHLLRLASEVDAQTWSDAPLDAGELTLADVADWGPSEDWSEWTHAAG